MVDSAGNSYITGFESGAARFGNDTLTGSGVGAFIFLASYTASGGLRWVNEVDGSSVNHAGRSLAICKGALYLVGDFRSTAYFQKDTLYSFTPQFSDAFIARYNLGGAETWVRQAGGPIGDGATGVACDGQQNAYTVGGFTDTLAIEAGAGLNADSGNTFLIKYHKMGNVIWAKALMGTGVEVDTDTANNLYLVGYFRDTLVIGSDTLKMEFPDDVFLAKYNEMGQPIWARQSLGNSGANPFGLCVSPAGQSYLTGSFNGPTAIFGQDTLRGANGYNELFVASYNAEGQALWALDPVSSFLPTLIGYGVTLGQDPYPLVTGNIMGSAVLGPDTLQSRGFFLTKVGPDLSTGLPGLLPESGLSFQLGQNYPNPFSSHTRIPLTVHQAQALRLQVFTVSGQLLLEQDLGHLPTGHHQVLIESQGLSAGQYFYQIRGKEGVLSRRMQLIY